MSAAISCSKGAGGREGTVSLVRQGGERSDSDSVSKR